MTALQRLTMPARSPGGSEFAAPSQLAHSRDLSLPWYVAQLKPNGFQKARQNLMRQGYACFMPMRETIIRKARSERCCLRPLFPGYLFIGFDPASTQWRAINNTLGVNRLICARADLPQAVPQGMMWEMFNRCREDDVLRPAVDLSVGDAVRVVSGPFAGVLAEVDQVSNQARVALLLDLMGRATRAEFARADLEKISAP